MLILGRKDPFALYFKAHLWLGGLSHRFPFKFPEHTMEEPAEFFVLFYIPKVAFCLYGTDLAVHYPLFDLYIGTGFPPPMILELNAAEALILFQVQQVFLNHFPD